MKTSNKLLLAPIALYILLGLMGMVYLRNSLVPRGIGDGKNFLQGEGEYKKKDFPVASFSKIIAGNGMQFQLVKGREVVEIEAEENLLPHFETTVEDGELSIQVAEGYSLRPSENKPINIKIGFQNLERLTSHGGATIVMKDTVEIAHFQCHIHSGSNVSVLVKAQKLTTHVHSGSDLEISGYCETLEGQAHGSGDLKAFDLICANSANVSAHAGSDMQLHVLGVLTASIHSGAHITYKGDPAKVHSNTHSGGSIRQE